MSDDPVSSLLIIIPARGGSRGVPGKNLAEVGGISLVGRAVIAARRFAHAKAPTARIIVDTDSEAIANEGRRWGAEVPFLRPTELARDTTQTVDNVLHLVDRLGDDAKELLLLQPTSPMRDASDIAACWEMFERSGGLSAVTAVLIDHPAALSMLRDEGGLLTWPGEAPESTRRQDHPEYWRPNGAVYAVSTSLLRSTRRFVIDGITRGVPMPVSRSVDIDTPEDLEMARRLAASSLPVGVGYKRAAPLPAVITADELAALPTLEAGESIERLVGALVERVSPKDAIVRFGPYDAEADARLALGFLLPLRSVLGVASVWMATAARPQDALAAIALGVSAVVAPPGADDHTLNSMTDLVRSSRQLARTGNP